MDPGDEDSFLRPRVNERVGLSWILLSDFPLSESVF
jgi:hypothetical protein